MKCIFGGIDGGSEGVMLEHPSMCESTAQLHAMMIITCKSGQLRRDVEFLLYICSFEVPIEDPPPKSNQILTPS